MSGPKADAILSRASDASRPKKKKRRLGDGSGGVAEGGGVGIVDEDAERWGTLGPGEDEDEGTPGWSIVFRCSIEGAYRY
jgi:hypothetical protein